MSSDATTFDAQSEAARTAPEDSGTRPARRKADDDRGRKKPEAAAGKGSGKNEPADEKGRGKTESADEKARKKTELEGDSRKEATAFDLTSPEFYLNRELTWLSFNERVLHEAEDERTPLMERIKFLAITSSNLDEFFMKRIGGLKQQVGAGMRELTIDGRRPEQQIAECYRRIREMEQRQQRLRGRLVGLLRDHGVIVARYSAMGVKDQATLRAYYFDNIFPLVTPQAMDPAHPFPFISNLSLNLLVTLHHPKDQAPLLARVKVPVGTGIPRFLRLRDEDVFVPLEEVIANNLDLLFPAMTIDRCSHFRATRNANTALNEVGADDLMDVIESGLRERKFAPIVRLEVSTDMKPVNQGMLAAELGLNEGADVFTCNGMMGLRDLWELCKFDLPIPHNPPHHPVDHPALVSDRSIFHIIRESGSILLHHPYQSFATSVERFLREASEDPNVRAIKMTLYRTSAGSPVIKHLISAARNGKQVAVAVELKARFDEEANIRWANLMEEVGIHVSYGVMGVKTHCKTILVVRQDYNGLRRYCHIGTGNYHSETARLYSDQGLLTCDPAIGQDLTELFNFLTTGYRPKRNYNKLLPAPAHLKPALLQKIQREIDIHNRARPGHIQLKMNALEDVDVTQALYRASQAGVRVDLLVRDSCRLRPGIPGLSENVRVISIVGRFLEHTRVFYFQNGDQPEYYIGSADCMKRNLEQRVEAMVPVESPELQEEMRMFLDAQISDQRSAWEMGPDGTYVQREPAKGKKAKSAQSTLIEWADRQHEKATRLHKRKPKSPRRKKR